MLWKWRFGKDQFYVFRAKREFWSIIIKTISYEKDSWTIA